MHVYDVSKQIPREKNFSAIFHYRILLLKKWSRLRRQFKLNIESCEEADEKEMFPENKIINALKRNRGNINPFTTFKPSG